ncbi:Ig-like domain-containing protein [Pyxidicoccus parkwayensis]|uniref:Ig-like domain-containing protein n=1 Tax=Pyxidicoccus parkwayensis TaxID=2813578 RepID=A0ABX7P2S3_9BACT|nr:Ig-like domain-containing protein [Pyxidicoccus parkwaysis]
MLTVQPTTALAQNTTYTVTIDGEDRAGNPLKGTRVFSFTTSGPTPDTVPPTVLSTSPNQASIGNARTALLEVVFSEPMNKTSVQTAFAITAPAGFNGGSFAWNEAGTVMTYTPSSQFTYGTDVSWQVSTNAKDAAGNSLSDAMTRSFRVVRQGLLIIKFDPYTSGSVGAPEYFRQTHLYNVEYLGDNSANSAFRLFVGFKLNELPSDLSRITQATLRWWVTFQLGNPYSKLGQLILEPVNVGEQLETAGADDPPNPALIEDYHSAPLSTGINVLSNAVGAPGTLDVTSWVAKDWSDRATRNGRTQYRFRFTQGSNNDGTDDRLVSDVGAHPTLAELQVVYEYP